MSAAPYPVDPARPWPVFDVASTRRIEHQALQAVAPHTLMQRAGLATARLALAIAPHARNVWVAAGPGNNGGDGLEAAAKLQRWGKQTTVTWLGARAAASADTAASLQRSTPAWHLPTHHRSGSTSAWMRCLVLVRAARRRAGWPPGSSG